MPRCAAQIRILVELFPATNDARVAGLLERLRQTFGELLADLGIVRLIDHVVQLVRVVAHIVEFFCRSPAKRQVVQPLVLRVFVTILDHIGLCGTVVAVS